MPLTARELAIIAARAQAAAKRAATPEQLENVFEPLAQREVGGKLRRAISFTPAGGA